MRLTDLHPATVVHATVASAGAFGRGMLRLLVGELDPHGDAQVTLSFGATPTRVWAVLADGEGYGDWVIGANPVLDVDADWPAAGAALHYSVGIGPLEVRDRTTVQRSEPEHLLDLDVVGPLGSVRVLIRLEPDGISRTLVRLDEHGDGGLARLLHTPFASAAFAARGTLMLHRLRALAEQPTEQVDPPPTA